MHSFMCHNCQEGKFGNRLLSMMHIEVLAAKRMQTNAVGVHIHFVTA